MSHQPRTTSRRRSPKESLGSRRRVESTIAFLERVATLSDAERKEFENLRQHAEEIGRSYESWLARTWDLTSPLGRTLVEKRQSWQLIRAFYDAARSVLSTAHGMKGSARVNLVFRGMVLALIGPRRILSGPLLGSHLFCPLLQVLSLGMRRRDDPVERLVDALVPAIGDTLTPGGPGSRKRLTADRTRAFEITHCFLEKIDICITDRHLKNILRRTTPGPGAVAANQGVMGFLSVSSDNEDVKMAVDFYIRQPRSTRTPSN